MKDLINLPITDIMLSNIPKEELIKKIKELVTKRGNNE